MSTIVSGGRRSAFTAGIAVLAVAAAILATFTMTRRSDAAPGDLRVLAVARFLGTDAVTTDAWQRVEVMGHARDQANVLGVGLVQVDPATREVLEVIWEDRLERVAGPAVPAAVAAETARGFALAHFAGFGDLAPRGSELVDHGTFREHRVVWQAKAGAAWLPTSVVVGVNADSGAVAYYWADRRPVTVPTVPVVSASTAVATARTATGRPDATADQNELTVVEDASGQRLAYVVRLTGGARPAGELFVPRVDVVHVDALSGAAAVTTR